jgi:alpha-tubulin suppressor-like RCC1 family protein
MQGHKFGCGNNFAAAVTAEGKLVVWGHFRTLVPIPHDLENVVAVSCGAHHLAVLTLEKKVACFGDTAHGRCSVPPDLGDVMAVSCSFGNTAALTESGKVVCWGTNFHGPGYRCCHRVRGQLYGRADSRA